MNVRRLAVIGLVAAGCASQGMPPGGPEDKDPPRIVAVLPESGSIDSRVKEVVIKFDEVISEIPRSGPDLRSAVIISPREGEPDVDWKRNEISIRPRRGWRDSTTYVITLLPGIVDLDGNQRDSATVVVFSTGGAIPNTRVYGTTFDWVRGTVASRAFLEAYPVADTTVRYAAESDSIGRFLLPFMRPGAYVIRGLIDADRNKRVDAREAWDTIRVELRDSAAVDLYLFPHDSAGPIINNATVVDSLTVRISLDKPATSRPGYIPELQFLTRDSTPVAIRRIVPWPVIQEERDRRMAFERDSTANADTSSVRRAARAQARTDSINRAVLLADSLARLPARIQAAKLARPPLVTEYGVQLVAPLAPGTTYRLIMTVIGMSGNERISRRDLPVQPRAQTDSAGGGRGRGGSFQR